MSLADINNRPIAAVRCATPKLAKIGNFMRLNSPFSRSPRPKSPRLRGLHRQACRRENGPHARAEEVCEQALGEILRTAEVEGHSASSYYLSSYFEALAPTPNPQSRTLVEPPSRRAHPGRRDLTSYLAQLERSAPGGL